MEPLPQAIKIGRTDHLERVTGTKVKLRKLKSHGRFFSLVLLTAIFLINSLCALWPMHFHGSLKKADKKHPCF